MVSKNSREWDNCMLCIYKWLLLSKRPLYIPPLTDYNRPLHIHTTQTPNSYLEKTKPIQNFWITNTNTLLLTNSYIVAIKKGMHVCQFVPQRYVSKSKVCKLSVSFACHHELQQCFQTGISSESTTSPVTCGNGSITSIGDSPWKSSICLKSFRKYNTDYTIEHIYRWILTMIINHFPGIRI